MVSLTSALKFETLTVSRDGDPVSDGSGGWKPGPAVTHGVPGQLQPLTIHDELVARSETANVMWAFFCDFDADIRRGDHGTIRGFDVEVEGVRSSAKPGVYRRATLKERQT